MITMMTILAISVPLAKSSRLDSQQLRHVLSLTTLQRSTTSKQKLFQNECYISNIVQYMYEEVQGKSKINYLHEKCHLKVEVSKISQKDLHCRNQREAEEGSVRTGRVIDNA